MRSQLFKTFVSNSGGSLEGANLVYLIGDEVIESLFTLNKRFSENIEQIRSIPYNPLFEKEADAAIEAEILHDKDWKHISAEAWRVLLERLIQSIMVAQINQLHENPLIPIPKDLPRDSWTGAAMIFLMYDMKLPFPVADRSNFSMSADTVPGSLTHQ